MTNAGMHAYIYILCLLMCKHPGVDAEIPSHVQYLDQLRDGPRNYILSALGSLYVYLSICMYISLSVVQIHLRITWHRRTRTHTHNGYNQNPFATLPLETSQTCDRHLLMLTMGPRHRNGSR